MFLNLFSCASQDFEDENPNEEGVSRNRFIDRIKPSESMQIGIPKKIKFRNFSAEEASGFDNDDQSDSSYYEKHLTKSDQDTNDDEKNNGLIKQVDLPEGEYSGTFKVGNPYKISGIGYVPKNYDSFEEIGIASWYGDDFHGKKTANGEIYNMEDLTAAHRTLPLPSLARVTNLQNGKKVIVRINDRGPFAKNRVIDVSLKAAEILGFKKFGTTEVRVEFLREETDEMLKKLKIKTR